jgi:hypothetical protein
MADPSTATGRDEFQEAYASQLQNSPALFATAPVYHIIPAENTITFAGQYQYYDVTVARPGVDISTNRDNLDERLDMTGYAASPYVAFESKQFGFGFAGEVGKREVHYLRQAGSPDGGYDEHLGIAQYSGLGLNLFWTPGWTFLPKFIAPTLIVGGKSLNVVENSSGDVVDPYGATTMTKYQYSVQNYEAGCNISLKLVKHFTVIPWVDYSSYVFGTPKLSSGVSNPAGSTTDPTVSDDARLFWQSSPALTYGIDFAVDLFGLNIHLGGLIGILGTLDKGSDRIQDNSHTVSISIDTKGG